MDNATKRIMGYLNELAKEDNALALKLADTSVKNSEKMMKYITDEARKLCAKGENRVCVDDDTVFKWARHYWLDYEEKVKTNNNEEETDENEEIPEVENYKVKGVKVVQSKEKETKDYEQMSLFDF